MRALTGAGRPSGCQAGSSAQPSSTSAPGRSSRPATRAGSSPEAGPLASWTPPRSPGRSGTTGRLLLEDILVDAPTVVRPGPQAAPTPRQGHEAPVGREDRDG